MSYEEKRSIVSIISTMLVYAVYCIYLYLKYKAGDIDPENDLRFLGIVILVFIPLQIVINIIIHIVFTIINAIVTREESPELVDERDKLIDLKAGRVSHVIGGIGFLVSIISLAIGMIPFIMLNIIYFSFNAGEIIGSILKLYFYKRGF